ncbi:glycosyl transferase [Actinopolyspora mortivallis]|uniref:Glycosyl transferase n=2 Tax=Actinopolyspora mortivallis TaxID=33906 RepID=A0A2T0GYX1_ACTMO|nr:glycosyl transferase [Actinopolyspora mortivallis]
MLSVAEELVGRGHRVRWYTGAAFRESVRRSGARFEPMRAAYDFSGMTREQAFPHHAGLTGLNGMTTGFREIFLDPAPDQMADLLDLVEVEPPDVLVTDETIFGAGFAREHLGLRQVWVSTSVYLFSSRDTAPFGLGLFPSTAPWARVRNAALRLAAHHVVLRGLRRHGDRIRSRVGLAPMRKGPFENVVHPPDLYLMSTVPSFEYPLGDMLPQTRFVGPLQSATVPDGDLPPWWDELDGRRPVVHLTQGTVANDWRRLLAPGLEALAEEDVTVIATTGADPEDLDLGPLPGNARLCRFVPHAHLLPRTDVMVTNGGYGGVNSALSHGVPLVVAAATEEKHEVGQRVAWSGAGIHLRKRRLSRHDIRDAVRRVLSEPSFVRRAGELRAEYRDHGGRSEAVDRIEELVSGGPSTGPSAPRRSGGSETEKP